MHNRDTYNFAGEWRRTFFVCDSDIVALCQSHTTRYPRANFNLVVNTVTINNMNSTHDDYYINSTVHTTTMHETNQLEGTNNGENYQVKSASDSHNF